MADNLLQTYLNNQFIKTTEEGNITNLKKAVDEVVKQLQKKKSKIIPYTLVAIDPQISENDPVVIEVEKIIIKKWSTFKNVTSTKDKATTYVRAVILEALKKISKEDELSALIWLSSRNLIQHYKLNKEEEVLASFFQSLADQTETKAQAIWGNIIQVEMPSFSIPGISVDKKIVSKSHLTKRLHAAAGPSSVQDGTNVTNENANRYWPNQNQNWAGDFGDIAGEAIASSINSVLKDQNQSLSNIGDQINESLHGLEPFLNEVGKSMMISGEATNKRSQLLWWKETLFSSSLRKSYRSMSPIATAIIMAIDLASLVGEIYPESVDFLLRESLKSAHGNQVDEDVDLDALLDQASKLEVNEKLLLKGLIANQEGRKSLGVWFANTLNGENSDVFGDVGIDKAIKVSLANFSVWIFHDLQAQKIALKK